ncbi:MAG: hypothetical protein UU02_C0024G0014 [Candidatus Woesebacteria bacterium GW2011_GWA1_40_43]|uniref:Uncharacterized protein n=1 Tax=Candidatus Woesebacteria bacterium GW2011_GWA1_40_43 TaxID=1618553 RepID=A0A0G0SM52_9BACT|nr:MAG: hypothetical protein UT88_C0011G0010 [Candidatus Woesebacteria bacterium GW2011_GWD2_40_19]KKR58347.1 MAG: hypothetical protein UT96_C0007G0014 [Candidatus Woesebacteria bacterium GW2011_GWC2_40_30]KKR63471.1 MAG: hypothetical protein UU02_C0024G0014 [Candidatus Woesebacteria bacterium GW2011_GWA1_40_43]
MTEQMDALVKGLEKSFEVYSSDDETIKLIALEIEKIHHHFGNPRISRPNNRRISVNGFKNHRDANSCAGWLIELLLQDGWLEYERTDVAHNEKWFKKPK